jgi:hypothetical protein
MILLSDLVDRYRNELERSTATNYSPAITRH